MKKEERRIYQNLIKQGILPSSCDMCPIRFKFYRCGKNYDSIQCAIERGKEKKKLSIVKDNFIKIGD
jgi:hypothetical protein